MVCYKVVHICTLSVAVNSHFYLRIFFGQTLNVTFLLILFLGNLLRNTSAKVSGSIAGHCSVVKKKNFF